MVINVCVKNLLCQNLDNKEHLAGYKKRKETKKMVELRKITEAEYVIWKEIAIQDYAVSLRKANDYSEEVALDKSKTEFSELLPHDLETPSQEILVAMNVENESVGVIWVIFDDPKTAFIADFIVYESYRRRGFAKSILTALELRLKAKGFDTIRLHVFNENQAAINLYEKCGYEKETVYNASFDMCKKLMTN